MIQSVIFDLDGLLIDSEAVSYKIYQEWMKKYGCGFPIDYYAQNLCGRSSVHNMNLVIQDFHLPLSLEEGLAISTALEEKYVQTGFDLKEGVKELLEFLKSHKYKISLASSSVRERALTILRHHDVDHYFDTLTFGYEVPNGKPAPDIFLAACGKTGIAPEHSLVLEDSEAGIQAAFSAGIPVICVPDMKRPGKEFLEKSLAVVDSLSQVINYLQTEKASP